MKNKLNLLIYFLKKDIKVRYAGSGLGLLWTIFTPLVQIILFWFVFSGIMKARPYANTQMPYIYFLLSSFFFWLAFSEGIIRSSNVIIENSEIVKKISFPNILLPITVTISSYLLNILGFLFFMIAYATTTTFSPVIVLVIPLLLLQFLFSLGLGMFLAALLPYIRDLGQILGYILQGIFFLSPIIYGIESVPEKLRIIFYFNPMTYFASSYHNIILLKEPPRLLFVCVIIVISTVSLIGGFYTFKKLKDGFADVL
jgi:ABC-type polysaccharide/polyol phosphate export permease